MNCGPNSSPECFTIASCEEKPCSTSIKYYANIIKIGVLICIWIVCSYCLISSNWAYTEVDQIKMSKNSIYSIPLKYDPSIDTITVMLKGPFLPDLYSNLSNTHLNVWVEIIHLDFLHRSNVNQTDMLSQNVSEIWKVSLPTFIHLNDIPKIQQNKVLNLTSLVNYSNYFVQLTFTTTANSHFTFLLNYKVNSTSAEDKMLYAVLILVLLYVTFIFDIIHRTLASILASTIAIATLAVLDGTPSVDELISWIDVETVAMLFSLMTIVSIFSETGFLDYVAILALKHTGGKLWPLVNTLCVLSCLCSCFLDSITTSLLITPITIRLCEVMKINPIQIVTYIIIFSNIGGAITPTGDPQNVLIISYPDVENSGISFASFTIHSGIGALITIAVIYLQIRLMYKDPKYYQFDEQLEIEDIKAETVVWERISASVSDYRKEKAAVKNRLLRQMVNLQNKLKDTADLYNNSFEMRGARIENLYNKRYIRNKSLLIKSGVTLVLMITAFFFHSLPVFKKLGLGWIAILGVILLLVLYDSEDLQGIFAKVEWSLLIFFASLFTLIEALSRLGLIDWIGKQTQYVITSVTPDERLVTAIIIVLWISALGSAFVDSLPLATMMIRIVTDLSENEELNLPLAPLIWALALGSCLGGNGSLFGSTSNLVSASLVEQHGYKFTFMDFTKVGFPVMIVSVIAVTIYLLICHGLFHWH